MKNKKVAIIGGGLSGVYAAYLLEQAGFDDYVLLEAKEYLGGRILATPPVNEANALDDNTASLHRFDLGPTWFWPQIQPQLAELISELKLETFEQYDDGDMLIERENNRPVSRMPGYVHSPIANRLVGGMSSLIDALSAKLNKDNIVTNCQVKRLSITGESIELLAVDKNQNDVTYSVNKILLALPPRLTENAIEFIPSLPERTKHQWRSSGTWMAGQAKYVAVYEKPFWRNQGFSGHAASLIGVMGEIHDASASDDVGALFGFLRVPPAYRNSLSNEELKSYCRAQIVNLFGPEGACPKADFIKDWAQDPFVATDLDIQSHSGHSPAPDTTVSNGPWEGKLNGIASEWATIYPGYLAGAIEAASKGVNRIIHTSLVM